jgi:glycosyltransferase involved in cell wall biosynthesis
MSVSRGWPDDKPNRPPQLDLSRKPSEDISRSRQRDLTPPASFARAARAAEDCRLDLVALIPERSHVSARYRILAFQPWIERAGLNFRVEPLAETLGGRVRQLLQSRRNQVVFLLRRLLPVWQQLLLRRAAARLVYDFDDAIFLRESNHPRGSYSYARASRFGRICRLADLVIAGNDHLAAHARRSGSQVDVVPTCVDCSAYPTANHGDHDPVRLAWVGNAGNLRRIVDGLGEVFESLANEQPRLLLRAVCNQFPEIRGLEVERRLWSSATEASDLAGCDLGISWLPDDAWSPGKCGLKAVQYMAAGLPVLASPIGVHRSMVPAEVGEQPHDAAAWRAAILRLARDPARRAFLGAAARRHAERHFDLAVWGPRLADRLNDLANGRGLRRSSARPPSATETTTTTRRAA